MSERPYLPALDGLRACALLTVVEAVSNVPNLTQNSIQLNPADVTLMAR